MKALNKICKLLLGKEASKLESVSVSHLDSAVGATYPSVTFPYSSYIEIDEYHLLLADMEDLLDTLVHECHHVLTLQNFIAVDVADSIDHKAFNHVFENGASAASFILINYIKNQDKIEDLLLTILEERRA